MRLFLRSRANYFACQRRFVVCVPFKNLKSARKLGCTVLDSDQSVLRVMTIQEHRRHPQGMLFKDITKDMIIDMIWIC